MFDGMENLLDEVIVEFRGRILEYYDMPEKLFKLIMKQPYSAGRFIGYIRRGILIPSFELMREYVERYDKNYIIVNEKAEELFVYGRDIFQSSVLVDKSTIDYVIVCNKDKEVIGLAKKEKKIFKNIVDVGLFLRKFK